MNPIDVVRLERKVRFAVVPRGQLADAVETSSNGFAGRPSIVGFGRHYEVVVACVGTLDPRLQYVVDIKNIDRAVRETVIAAVCDACGPAAAGLSREHPPDAAGVLIPACLALNELLSGMVLRVTFYFTPTHTMNITLTLNADPRVVIRQRFDFAASHRLHNPALSAEENAQRYGKCNNPRGHGHNYQFEIAAGLDSSASTPFTLQHLEAIAERTIIDRFDHKHLNEDTAEFDITRGGLIPTVENIARVFHAYLAEEFAARVGGATLVSVTVWETDRTSATYPAT